MIPAANHVWQSTLFAIAALLLSLALRKNRADVRYWIWLAASVKFLIPFALIAALGSQLPWRAAPIARAPVAAVATQITQPFGIDASVPPGAPPPGNYLPAILLILWLSGVVPGVIHWLRLLRRIHCIRRSATPLHLDLPIPALSSPARLEPGVSGIRNPVLILPAGITGRLTPAQLEAVLAHELCHVRRRDNLTAAIHLVVEILFWFHPLVWYIRTQLLAERECACDEAVLARTTDPQLYAEAILNVCRFYVESPLACVSGITGSDLKQRIRNITAARVPHHLNAGRRILLAAAGIAVVAAPVAIGLAQEAAGRKAFEVSSVKPSPNSDEGRTPWRFKENPGGIDYKYITVDTLIHKAYGLEDYQITLPRGYKSTEWDIAAKAPADSRTQDFPMMLRSLLADRFQLTFHREMKEMAVYELVVAEGGSKLKQTDAHEGGLGGNLTAEGMVHWKGNVSVSLLAYALTHSLRTPVLDKTGIQGVFAIEFEHTPLTSDAPADGALTANLPGPTISNAMEKFLGLKLVPRKDPVEVLVVDHVAAPTGN